MISPLFRLVEHPIKQKPQKRFRVLAKVRKHEISRRHMTSVWRKHELSFCHFFAFSHWRAKDRNTTYVDFVLFSCFNSFASSPRKAVNIESLCGEANMQKHAKIGNHKIRKKNWLPLSGDQQSSEQEFKR